MPDLANWPSLPALRRLTGAALLGALIIFVLFTFHDRPLAPDTIVSYELAWTSAGAARLFAAWGEAGRQVARESLWIDLVFMPAYAFFFAGLALTEARLARAPWARRLGARPAALPLGAWLCDVVENLALLRVLANTTQPDARLLAVAGVAATLKFALLGLCIVYIVGAVLARRRPITAGGA